MRFRLIHGVFLIFPVLLAGSEFDVPIKLDIDPRVYDEIDERLYYRQAATVVAHVSDIHHYAPSLYDAESTGFQGFALYNEGRTVLHTGALLEALRQDLLAEGADVLVISGDLTILGTRETHEDVALILAGFETSGIRVFITTGNHDINNPRAYRIVGAKSEPVDSVSPEDFREIYGPFGFGEAVMAHDQSLSYMAELDDDYYLLALDTAWYQDNDFLGYAAPSGIIVLPLYDFAERALAMANREGRRVIVMSHHNFLRHYETDVDLSNFMVNDEGRMLDLLTGAGIGVALSGHIHKSDIKARGKGESTFYGIATTSLALYPHSYRLLGLDPGALGVSTRVLALPFGEDRNTEIWEYNRRIGWEWNYRRRYGRLADETDAEEAAALAAHFYLVNLYSQQGLEAYIPEAILMSPGATAAAGSDSRIMNFARTLPRDSPPGDRDLVIEW